MTADNLQKPIYLKQILELTGWSKSKFWRIAKDLHKAGAIYYEWEGYGEKRRKRVKAFPHRLEKYLHFRSLEVFPEDKNTK